MRIAVVGTGYVGLVSGACMAELGNSVWCVDVDEAKIAGLQRGEVPIYEPGLEDLVLRNSRSGRLHFSVSLSEVLPLVEMLFIAVGTPPTSEGEADLSYVFGVAQSLAELVSDDLLVVMKSTVPVGTTRAVESMVREGLSRRGCAESVRFEVASNPEFLKEGDAIDDFLYPDRVIVGVESEVARQMMEELYRPMMRSNFRVIFMDIPSAEMTKYASNAMLATRISFMNEVANLCERVGADIASVRRGMGSDSRIGNKFLYPGAGYGGSCFPKDVRALIHLGEEHGSGMSILRAVDEVNEAQKGLLFKKFYDYYGGEVKGLRVGIWGLAFKPGTDDMRSAPSLRLIDSLLEAGCQIRAYDPVAMDEARRRYGERIEFGRSVYDVVEGADALFHVTEWKEFRMPDWSRIRSLMRRPLVVDGRNVFLDQDIGLPYLWIGGAGVKGVGAAFEPRRNFDTPL